MAPAKPKDSVTNQPAEKRKRCEPTVQLIQFHMSIFVLRVSGFGSVWTYPVLVAVRVWFSLDISRPGFVFWVCLCLGFLPGLVSVGLCWSWRSCCVFPVSLLGASLLVLSRCGRTGQLGLPSCLFVHASALEGGWGVLCWVALFLLSCSPLAAAAAVGFRGSCCLPCAAAWRAARISASLLVGCSRVSLRALRLLPCSGSGGFSVLAVFRFWVLMCWFFSCRFWFKFWVQFCLVELCIFLENSVSESVLVKFGSNKNFGLPTRPHLRFYVFSPIAGQGCFGIRQEEIFSRSSLA